MNLKNLKNYKFWIGAGLSILFLCLGVVLDISGGFIREFIAIVSYLISGSLAGIGAYYVFIETESY